MTLLCVGVLAGCGGAKEVDSRDEANRILLSASSTIAECEKVIKDYKTILDDTKMSPENKLSQVKEKDLNKFMGSKYTQSTIGETYKQVNDFLENDRYVLFTGTPCQIEGLKSYYR